MNVKKILILGTQSSGGTLFTQMLASRLNCISILDLRSGSAGLTSEDIDSENMPWLVKVVITKKVPPNQHIRSFNPDKVISIIRHPEKILRSLD
ncbi:MAG: hypothetical protein KC649_02365 [Candidatus Omnitrophica bacterium]|nr:hypothetical protein [Candidatus Omnitrophota bacterium]